MKKFKKLWKKNKIATLFGIVVILILIIALVVLYPLFFSKSGDLYGHRLDGIKDVSIKDDINSEVIKYFKKTNKVDSVNVNLKGKLYNVVINIKDGEDINKIIDIVPNCLDKFSSSQIKYYDFQFFVVSKDSEKTVVGYKNKDSKSVIWTNNNKEE